MKSIVVAEEEVVVVVVVVVEEEEVVEEVEARRLVGVGWFAVDDIEEDEISSELETMGASCM